MVKEAYEDILDSFEKSAKKKEEEGDKEKVYDTPLGKKHVVKGALVGAKGASDEKKLSQLSPERQKAIKKKLIEAGDRYNAAVKKGYKNNEDEFTGATNDLNTAMAEYNKALREGKQIIKDKKANKK